MAESDKDQQGVKLKRGDVGRISRMLRWFENSRSHSRRGNRPRGNASEGRQPLTGNVTVTVHEDGSGDFTTVKAALDHLARTYTPHANYHATINILSGHTWGEQLYIAHGDYRWIHVTSEDSTVTVGSISGSYALWVRNAVAPLFEVMLDLGSEDCFLEATSVITFQDGDGFKSSSDPIVYIDSSSSLWIGEIDGAQLSLSNSAECRVREATDISSITVERASVLWVSGAVTTGLISGTLDVDASAAVVEDATIEGDISAAGGAILMLDGCTANGATPGNAYDEDYICTGLDLGYSGTFDDNNGNTITVSNGIITDGP